MITFRRISPQAEYISCINTLCNDNNSLKKYLFSSSYEFDKITASEDIRVKYNFTLPQDCPEIDIQWFAPEDEGRTEDPTEHKIRKAREEGKVAKSPELAPSLVLIFTITTIAVFSKFIMTNILEMMTYFFTVSSELDIEGFGTILPVFLSYFLKVFIPIALVAFTAALMGNLMQVGILFSTKPITPDFNKISPDFVRFFKRAVFSTEAVFNLFKTLVKVVIIGVLLYMNLRMESDKLIHLSTQTILTSMALIARIVFRLIIESGIAMLVLSLPDYMFQRKQHRESLKMSRQEIKEEMKQLEGDPRIRNMLMERMRELMSQNMIQNVPEADVVVTNPTHYSVAIKYERFSMEAPQVTAKGQDEIAFRIREVAKENNVPVMENKPLARALFAEVKVGDEIPVQYWEMVSIVLSEVYRLGGRDFEAV